MISGKWSCAAWCGVGSVPRFLLSLTELQSHVTRKMPALNNAKPERTIASIALASVRERPTKRPRRGAHDEAALFGWALRMAPQRSEDALA
jgi:hypothetical protein